MTRNNQRNSRFFPKSPTRSDGIVMGLAVLGICANVLMTMGPDIPEEVVEITYEPVFALAMLDLDHLNDRDQ